MSKTKKEATLISKYALISFFAFLVDISLIYLLSVYTPLHYTVAVFLGYSVGSLIIYFLNKKYSFKCNQWIVLQFPVFITIAAIGMLLTQLSILLLVEVYGVGLFYSRIVAGAIIFFWNFFGHRHITFRGKHFEWIENELRNGMNGNGKNKKGNKKKSK